MKKLWEMQKVLHKMKPVETVGDLIDIDALSCNRTVSGDDFNLFITEPKSCTAICPRCKKPTDKVHQRQYRFILDLPFGEKMTFLMIQGRRFRCLGCNHVFTEKLDYLDSNQRQTVRYQKYLARLCGKNTVEYAAEISGLSCDATNRVFKSIADAQVASRLIQPPQYLGVDDIARSKGHNYNTVVSDLSLCRVLEILNGRKKEDIECYFSSMPREWKESIKAVSMDMSRTFEAVVQEHLPKAVTVIDRFHISAQLHSRIDEARRHIQNRQRKEDKHRVFGVRWVILKNVEDLTANELSRLNTMYEEDEVLAVCHELKEEFRTFFDYDEVTTKEKAASFMDYWITRVEESGIPELKSFTKTLSNWREQILNFWDHRISNGFVEGMNNKLQTLKRLAYGYRNHENFRRRVLVESA